MLPTLQALEADADPLLGRMRETIVAICKVTEAAERHEAEVGALQTQLDEQKAATANALNRVRQLEADAERVAREQVTA